MLSNRIKFVIPPPRRKESRKFTTAATILLLTALFFASRLYLLFHSPEIIENGLIDERQLGLFPLHLNIGLLMPFNNYQYDSYAGGEIVIGLINFLSFKLFGPTILALKLSCLLFTSALGALLFWFLKREFGIVEGIFGLILFIFAPPIYLKWSLRSVANHAEAAFIIALIFAVFFQIYKLNLQRHDEWIKRIALSITLGFLCGFGTYFSYDTLLVIVTVLVLYPLTAQAKALLVEIPLFCISFLAGFRPWLLFHFGESPFSYAYDFSFRTIGQRISSGEISFSKAHFDLFVSVLITWFQSVQLEIGGNVLFEGKYLDWIIGTLFLCALLVLFGLSWQHILEAIKGLWPSGARKRISSKEILFFPLLVYVPLHIVVFAIFGQRYHAYYWPQRYLLGMIPILWMIAAIAAGHIWHNGSRVMASVSIAIIALACLVGSHGLIDPQSNTNIDQLRGYTYKYFARTMNRYFTEYQVSDEAAFNAVGKRYAEVNEEFLHGFYAGIAYYQKAKIDSHIQYAYSMDSMETAAFAVGLGNATGFCSKQNSSQEKLLLLKFHPDFMPLYLQGVSDISLQARLHAVPD